MIDSCDCCSGTCYNQRHLAFPFFLFALSLSGVSHAGGLFGTNSDLQSTLLSSEQRVRELAQEVSELEKECSLREEQEEALKETVRELGRELDRVRVAGQKGKRMEYAWMLVDALSFYVCDFGTRNAIFQKCCTCVCSMLPYLE